MQAQSNPLECEGHPAGPFDSMGETVYCDGSCVTEPELTPEQAQRMSGSRVLRRLRDERQTAVLYARFGLYSTRRPPLIRGLGVILHPDAVTEAWHRAECPPLLKASLSRRVRVQWWLSRCLRGCSNRELR